MKIINEQTQVMSSINGDTTSFKIDPDDPFIFSILRKSLYSNPLKAVCREYIANGRDSHRERGNPDRPIEIIINQREGYFVVKDFGVGISPERMEQVVTWYGRSTKRDDNRQVGGFGLGMKSAWSMGNSFTITSRVDGVFYEYCAYIDDTSKGALKLINKRSMTDKEENGVEVRIPVGTDKVREVSQHIREIVRWWKIPAIIHGEPKVEPIIPAFAGDGWVILSKETLNGLYNRPLCISDGIPFYGTIPSETNITIPRNVILVFKTGELQLSANRETLYWSDITIKAFNEKIANFNKEYKVIIEKDLNALSTWHEKYLYIKNVIDAFGSQNLINGMKYKDPIEYDLPQHSSDLTYNKYKFRYKDGYYDEEVAVSYNVTSILSWNGTQSYCSQSGAAPLSLAQALKSGNTFIIYNDVTESVVKQLIEDVKKFETKRAAYETRLADFKAGNRKSQPSKPSKPNTKPYSGVLTKDLELKLNYYLKKNNISKNIYIVSLPTKLLPIKHDINLSEIAKIDIAKETKQPKPPKQDYIPDRIYCYHELYSHVSSSTLLNSKLVYIKFPTRDEMYTKLRNADFKQNFGLVKSVLSSKFGTTFILITEKEFNNLEKYRNHHKLPQTYITFATFIDEFIKDNPSILKKNLHEYNTTIETVLNKEMRNILSTHGKTEAQNILTHLAPITLSTVLKYNGRKSECSDFLTWITSLAQFNTEAKATLDKHTFTEYNVNEVVKKADKLKSLYPLLKYVYPTSQNKSEIVDYIRLVNQS